MGKYIVIVFLMVFSVSCSQMGNGGPGYDWRLFKNTPNWELAAALAKEDSSEIENLLKEKKFDLDMQEPVFGKTLLMLAAGNEKLISTEVLLRHGANVQLRDMENAQVIQEVCTYVNMNKNAFYLLQLLLRYGADANSLQEVAAGANRGYQFTPLEGAVANLNCAKLLLARNADIYFKKDRIFSIWFHMLLNSNDEGIFVAEYLIVNAKKSIPIDIYFSMPDNQPHDIYELLNLLDYTNDPQKEKARQRIIKYLKSIGFPKSNIQVYQNSGIS